MRVRVQVPRLAVWHRARCAWCHTEIAADRYKPIAIFWNRNVL
jgi:hypothetical protein